MSKLAVRTGALALVSTVVGGILLQLLLPVFGAAPLPWGLWSMAIMPASLGAGGLTAVFVHWAIGRRMNQVADFVEGRVKGDDLRRLPRMGADEIGRTADAVNKLFANMTSLQVDVIDQSRELMATREELRLKAELAEKSLVLETRLKERAVLFDVLRASVRDRDVHELLDDLADQLVPALGLRELAILLAEDADGEPRFVVRAVRGFADPDAVLGRAIARGEGVAGEVAELRRPIHVPDVTTDPDYLSFWGQAPREGSFTAIPIESGDQLIGLLAMTRATSERLAAETIRYLGAIADQVALAIGRARMLSELENLATHDELTGLPNRRLLLRQLEREEARAERFETAFSLIAFDIDHFKQLNDREGHPVGDAALRELARVLSGELRKVDTLARVGGEEFLAVLPKTTSLEAACVAEKLRAAIADALIPGGRGQEGGRLTISVGVTQRRPGESSAEAWKRADEALYAAKRSGRNRVFLTDDAGPRAFARS
ncbi:MAG: sensor domain-containing diguanylate cyclase [Deltaproteobacteria bacterium]|nr:sensor domain-containing diguanylate cyclase [Deltaproteobacteria bacterium]